MKFTEEQLEKIGLTQKIGVHELRTLARDRGVEKPTTKTKEQIYADLIEIAEGRMTPAKPSTRGRPPIDAARKGSYPQAVFRGAYELNSRGQFAGWGAAKFDALRAVLPSEKFESMIFSYPLKKGCRGLVAASERADTASALKTIVEKLQGEQITALVFDAPPEDEFVLQNLAGDIVISPLGTPSAEHIKTAEYYLTAAKQLAADGAHSVLVVYSLDALYRAYFTQNGTDALAAVQKFFGAGRSLEGAGSLTVIGFAADRPSVFFDGVSALANATIYLKSDGEVDKERSFVK